MKRKTKLRIEGQGVVTYHFKKGRWVAGSKDPIKIWGTAEKALAARKRFFESLGDSVEVER